MLVEIRTYVLAPGATDEYLAAYREHGMQAQVRHVGAPLGCYRSEVGELNQVVFLFAYADAAEREQRRRELVADPEFIAYFQRVRTLLVSQRCALMADVPLEPEGRR